jgi:hypothetical protein
VKASTQMRFNKSEVTGLAAQPSHKFEKEGVLFIREKQEGFFRKTESKISPQLKIFYITKTFKLTKTVKRF